MRTLSMSSTTAPRLLAVALFAISAGVDAGAAETTVGAKPGDVKSAASTAKEGGKPADVKSTGSSAKEGAKPADAKSAAAAAKEKARKGAASPADLQKLLDEAGKQRDTLIADYEGVMKQLKDATDEQKKALKERMEEQKKTFDEAMIALHKQIRDEARKQRAQAVGPKR